MSLKNIIKQEKLPDGKLRLHFKTDSGNKVYEYSKQAARTIAQGEDPAGVDGTLVEHRKRDGKR